MVYGIAHSFSICMSLPNSFLFILILLLSAAFVCMCVCVCVCACVCVAAIWQRLESRWARGVEVTPGNRLTAPRREAALSSLTRLNLLSSPS